MRFKLGFPDAALEKSISKGITCLANTTAKAQSFFPFGLELAWNHFPSTQIVENKKLHCGAHWPLPERTIAFVDRPVQCIGTEFHNNLVIRLQVWLKKNDECRQEERSSPYRLSNSVFLPIQPIPAFCAIDAPSTEQSPRKLRPYFPRFPQKILRKLFKAFFGSRRYNLPVADFGQLISCGGFRAFSERIIIVAQWHLPFAHQPAWSGSSPLFQTMIRQNTHFGPLGSFDSAIA